MKKIVFFTLLVFCFGTVISQQQLNFSFAENPNTLMLNPGAETNFSKHYGIPFFSGLNVIIGSTNVVLDDLFNDGGSTFQTMFERTLTQLKPEDFININTTIDVLNAGYRLNERDYLSFGFYQELDAIIYFPEDIVDLAYYGNNRFLNRTFSLSQLNAKAQILGVFHVGISRKISKKLNLGARFKIYSSSLNVETTNNSGTYTTYENNTNLLRQNLNNVDVELRTSGLIDGDRVKENLSSLYTQTFLGGNYGLGLDFGMTYHFSPQFEFTASILDFGFVRYAKNTKVYKAEGDYSFDGVNFDFDAPRDYWQELQDDFEANVPSTETEEAYTSWRPAKINAAIKYSFGKIRRKTCFTATQKEYYYNAIGFQVHNTMRPLNPQLALTGFLETSLSEKFNTKITYTMNDYDSRSIGGGFSFQWRKLNVFGFVDNILGLRDLATANSAAFSLGIHLVY